MNGPGLLAPDQEPLNAAAHEVTQKTNGDAAGQYIPE